MIYILTFFLTIIACYLLIKAKLIVASPTSRGSHTQTIVTSGGIALFFTLFILITSFVNVDSNITIFLSILGVITLIGALDDIYNISQVIRLIIQILLSIFFTIYFITMNPLEVLLITFLIVYLVNTINFIDGIDLLASTQIMFILLSLLFIMSITTLDYNSIPLPIVFIINISIISLVSFCIFNYPPASIFLGSSGAYYLGFLLGSIFAIMISTNMISIYTCLILYSVPMIDTSIVLITRFFNKLKFEYNNTGYFICSFIKAFKIIFFKAHSLHNYQIMARKYNSHLKVGGIILFINIIWYLPIAILSNIYPNFAQIMLLIAIIPYLIICIYNKTGIEEQNV